MTNAKLLSIVLALTLTLGALTAPAYATETAASETAEASGTAPAETSEAPETSGVTETQENESTPGETAESVPVSSIPADATAGTDIGAGAASSNAGIDAPKALTDAGALSLDAEAVLLYELSAETMVYAKNIDVQREPASLTKVMTCLLALEHGTLTDEITVSEEALADLDPAGSSSGLLAGEVFTLEQLLFCLMIESANDAAPVIAEYISGSEAAFVDLMNQKAQELGCTGTHFANTHGMHDDQHYTTARDMAKIMLAALEYDKFQEIYSTSRYVLPATNLHEERIMVTTNYLIGTTITSDYYDERVIGGKTGFTTPAGRCIACVAQDNGLEYLCVVLGASTISTDTYTTYGNFVAASEALDFGFDNFQPTEVLSPLAPIAQLPVAQATESVVVTPAESVTTLLPVDYDPSLLTTSYTLLSDSGLTAPLAAGEKVGVVEKYYGSVCVGQTDLVTVTGVERQVVAAAVNEVTEKISASPWRFVIIILAVLLAALLALLLYSAYIRHRNRKRRQRRRNNQRR